jgi:hypothetical protein
LLLLLHAADALTSSSALFFVGLPTSSDVEQEDEEEEEESDDEIIELDLGSEDEDGGGDPGESAYEQYLRERKRDQKAKNGGEDGLFMSEDEGFDSVSLLYLPSALQGLRKES